MVKGQHQTNSTVQNKRDIWIKHITLDHGEYNLEVMTREIVGKDNDFFKNPPPTNGWMLFIYCVLLFSVPYNHASLYSFLFEIPGAEVIQGLEIACAGFCN